VAVDAIAGKKAVFERAAIPGVVYTDPEIAWAGLTENQAREKNIEVQVARYPWAASGRAQTLGRPEGLTKLIFHPKTGRLLGMGVTGAGASELIAEGVLAMEMAATAHDLAATIHPHPTLSETIMDAAEMFLGYCTGLYRPKK
jgi:dihydrolipoamide dehydrogenase